MLLPTDEAHLQTKGYDYEVLSDQGMICVLIRNFSLPPGYDRTNTDLLLRLPQGFPDAQPDMFWCDPPIRAASTGNYPQAAASIEQYMGRSWQRFSRHLAAGAWKPGIDTLRSFLTLVISELKRAALSPS